MERRVTSKGTTKWVKRDFFVAPKDDINLAIQMLETAFNPGAIKWDRIALFFEAAVVIGKTRVDLVRCEAFNDDDIFRQGRIKSRDDLTNHILVLVPPSRGRGLLGARGAYRIDHEKLSQRFRLVSARARELFDAKVLAEVP